MYKEDSRLRAPKADAVLWRYMSYTKFVSLLTKNALFFSRADKLGDPFEGSLSPINIASRPEMYKGKPEDQYKLIGEMIKDLRRFTLVNCWHENQDESDAMWKLYSGVEDGIAIKTDFQSLSKSLQGSHPVSIGKVTYVDYDVTFIGEMETLIPFVHKRKSFEHEREVRALIVVATSGLVKSIIGKPAPYRIGMYHEVDTSMLIKEVVVSPLAEEWFVELVQITARTFGLSALVRQSSLADRPVWS